MSIATSSAVKPLQRRVPRGRLAVGFIVLTFAFCLVNAVRLIHQNAVNVPFLDEWDFLSYSTGETPVTWSWLWTPHNEHRMPLQRLLLVMLYRVTGHDFRAGCYVVLALLASVSCLLLWLMRRVRGHFVWTDAIFPLILLHLGHCENLLWSFQIQFAASALVPCLLLSVVLSDLNSRATVFVTLTAFVFSMIGFGAAALAYSPFFAVWIGILGWHRSRDSHVARRRTGFALIFLAAVMLAATGWYVTATPRLYNYPRAPSIAVALQTTLQFLTLSLGPWVALAWPVTGWVLSFLILTVLALLLYRLVLIPAERCRAAGLLLCWGGLFVLALGIGWGRSGLGSFAGFVARYTTLAVPAMYLIYVVVQLGSSGRWRSMLSGSLCVIALVSYFPNYIFAITFAEPRTAYLKKFESDLAIGMRSAVLAARHTRSANSSAPQSTLFIYPVETVVADRTLKLRQQQIGPFRRALLDQNSRFVALDPQPKVDNDFEWNAKERKARITRAPSTLKIQLPQPVYVQQLYLALFIDQAVTTDFPISVRLLHTGSSPESTNDWRVIPARACDIPHYLSGEINDAISGIQIIVGSAPTEFRITNLAIMSGEPPKNENEASRSPAVGANNETYK